MIPGSNLLMTALSVIGSAIVNYFQYQSKSTGPTGLDTVTYSAPVTIQKGSVQAVDRSRYEALGLDYEKRYVVWYVPNLQGVDLSRNPDNSGDVMEWPVTSAGALIPGQSRRYQFLGGTDWYKMDGWMSLLGVDIGPATGAMTNA